MGQDADELRRDIERTRVDLGGTLDAIGDRVSPSRMVERRTNRMRETVRSIHRRITEAPRGPWAARSPDVGVVAQGAALGADDAEAMAGGRLHDPPGADLAQALGAEGLEARDLGGDVVGLDVQVDPARVIDALDEDDGLVGAVGEGGVVALGLYDGAPQRGAPEGSGGVEVAHLAIDPERTQTALVHAPHSNPSAVSASASVSDSVSVSVSASVSASASAWIR